MVRVANEYLACACRVQQDNPKKNMSADRYERYKAARTLQQVLDLGGSRGDIANDMLRGYIVVEDREIHEAILMTANESERRHLPAHLLGRLPPAARARTRARGPARRARRRRRGRARRRRRLCRASWRRRRATSTTASARATRPTSRRCASAPSSASNAAPRSSVAASARAGSCLCSMTRSRSMWALNVFQVTLPVVGVCLS